MVNDLFWILLQPRLASRGELCIHVCVPVVMDAERSDQQVDLLEESIAGVLAAP